MSKKDKPTLSAIDHLVLTVTDIELTIKFYEKALGMTSVSFKAVDGTTRWALRFNNQKINLHQAGEEFEPKAAQSLPGTADLCFLSDMSLADWQVHLMDKGVKVIEGPVARTGAVGPLNSLYLRDPDGNLLEIGNLMR
ncbi:VOC family protein [Pseudopelagicola sp. nBUS_20]|uniref:VOC family protein n=1 Tax=Pseudopelagicola sp. nBUS_20 TaxID=3395317 RepID=UPI003EBFCD8A